MEHTEIDEMRRLHEAATPGPWTFWPGYGISPRMGVTISFDHDDEDEDVPPPTTALVIAMRNALPRLLAALEDARAERDNALHSMRVAEQCSGMANAERDRARQKIQAMEEQAMADEDGMSMRPLDGRLRKAEAERDKFEERCRVLAADFLGASEDRDAAESIAWDALGRPEGTHDKSNVQRLCEAYAATKTKLAHAEDRCRVMRVDYSDLGGRARQAKAKLAALAGYVIDHRLDCGFDPPNCKACTCGLIDLLAAAKVQP